MSSSKPLLLIDDRSSQIRYSSGWELNYWGGHEEYNQTTSRTYVRGATATLKFTGTGIGVYATLPFDGETPLIEFIVDDGPPGHSNIPHLYGMPIYQYNFWTSPKLAEGSHTLKLTNLIENGTLWLDFFAVTNEESIQNSGSTSMGPVAGESAQGGDCTGIESGTGLGADEMAIARGTFAGAIIGSLIGGMLLMGLVWALMSCIRRPKTKEEKPSTRAAMENTFLQTEPLVTRLSPAPELYPAPATMQVTTPDSFSSNSLWHGTPNRPASMRKTPLFNQGQGSSMPYTNNGGPF